jgi:hypothetical protein
VKSIIAERMHHMGSVSSLAQRTLVIASGALAGLSLLVGIVWWLLILYHGALAFGWQQARLQDGTRALIGGLVIFALAQILGCLSAFSLVRRARRSVSIVFTSLVVFVGLILLAGNLLYYFTPVVGAPLVVLAILLSTVILLVAPRGREA